MERAGAEGAASGFGIGFWSRWVVANGVGEMGGLGGVFTVGVLVMSTLGAPESVAGLVGLVLLVVALAVFEGAVVGAAQWLVLRRALPAISARAWVGATVVGAVIAWILGMLPSTVGTTSAVVAGSPPPAEPSTVQVTLLAAAMGVVLGTILAAVQWRVLRRHVQGASLWLAANALAWAAAMPLIFWLVGATLGERQTAGAVLLLALGLGGAGMVVGAVHGAFLLRLVARR